VVIQPIHTFVFEFSEGFAGVDPYDQTGYKDRAGNVIENPHSEVSSSEEAPKLVDINPKMGYINKAGLLIIQPEFDNLRNFYGGIARVEKNGKWGFIMISKKIKNILHH
jgi:WG containing repeat